VLRTSREETPGRAAPGWGPKDVKRANATGPGKDPKRMVKALALRVGLSVTLFLMLMAGYYFGLIQGRL
jgi:hypothetical protein